jgi:ribonuclease P protein subunit POP4
MQGFCSENLNLKKGFLKKISNKTLNLSTQKQQLPKKLKIRKKVLKISTEIKSYDSFLPLHKLWKEYFTSINNLDLFKIFKAELMGSIISVYQSKNVGLVGLSGIIFKETMNCFYIVTSKDKQFMLLKKESVFRLETGDDLLITIYGPNFAIRPYERVTKKVKVVGKLSLQ